MLSDETTSNPIEPRRRRISAESFRTGRNIARETYQNSFNNDVLTNISKVEQRVAVNERKISIVNNILGYQRSNLKENLKAVSPQAIMLRNLDAILDELRAEAKLEKEQKDDERRKAENERRRLRESKLEKRYEGLQKTTQKILAPVKGILDRIFQALIAIVAGKFLVKLISFVTDPRNKEKIASTIRFLSDNGPKLLAAYLLFGTRFGRSVGRLSGFLIKGAIRIGAATALLLRKLGLKSAGGLARGLLGRRGAAIGTGIQAATAAAGFIALQNFLSGGGGEEVQAFSGGGIFSSDGLVDGPYGNDQVNARLTDGEFVMSAPAVAAIGPSVLERINAKYGGDNTPRMVNGKIFANEGGLINFAPGLERLTAARTGQAGLGYYPGQIQPAQTLITRTDAREENKESFSLGPIQRRLPTRSELSAAKAARGFLKPGQMSGTQFESSFVDGIDRGMVHSIDRTPTGYTSSRFEEQTLSANFDERDLSENKQQLMSLFPQGTSLKNILNYNVSGMTPLEVQKTLATSDAYKATQARELEAERMYNEDLSAMGVDISKPFSDFGGVIKQDGRVFANTGILGFNKPKVMTPGPPAAGQQRVVVVNDTGAATENVPTLGQPDNTIPDVPLPGANRSKAATLQVAI
jgi:hypothetical protein